jgi:hypothetical protein
VRRSGFGGYFSHPVDNWRNRLPVGTVARQILPTLRSMTLDLRRRFSAGLPSIEFANSNTRAMIGRRRRLWHDSKKKQRGGYSVALLLSCRSAVAHFCAGWWRTELEAQL